MSRDGTTIQNILFSTCPASYLGHRGLLCYSIKKRLGNLCITYITVWQ